MRTRRPRQDRELPRHDRSRIDAQIDVRCGQLDLFEYGGTAVRVPLRCLAREASFDCSMENGQQVIRARENMLRRHLGTLYSCSTELPIAAMRRETSQDELILDRESATLCSSARCLIPEALVHENDAFIGTGGAYATDDVAAAAGVSISEVFCRTLPLRPSSAAGFEDRTASAAANVASPASATTSGAIEGNGDVDALREVLGRMYEGLQVVRSRQPSVAARPMLDEEEKERLRTGPADKRNAAQPLGLGPLATCARLHAGLVPLYTPLVESDDGAFLVRVERGYRCIAAV